VTLIEKEDTTAHNLTSISNAEKINIELSDIY
jgi:hypothetical protein